MFLEIFMNLFKLLPGMSKLVEIVKREFNPFKDMESIKFMPDAYARAQGYSPLGRGLGHNLLTMLTIVKPVGRGFLTGMALGALASPFTDSTLIHNISSGAFLCGIIDAKIYWYRLAYQYYSQIIAPQYFR